MLTERAIRIFSSFLYVGCNTLKFYPFVWDPINFRLLPAPKSHLTVFYTYWFLQSCSGAFNIYRLATVSNWNDISDRQKVMQAIWLVSHCLALTCFLQFVKTGTEIRHFVNALWDYILNNRGVTVRTDFVSGCMIFGGFMLYINGPAHGTGMIEIPCTPHFISSIAFPCRHPAEDAEGIVAKIPYLILETCQVTLMLFLFAFNWAIVFLGLAWIRRELRLLGEPFDDFGQSGCENIEKFEQDLFMYRVCQRINVGLNQAFRIYMEWFPTFLLGILSLLLYASIKLWYIPIHAYLLYPACSARCFFEVMTPLGMGGKVNEESIGLLKKWARRFKRGDETQFQSWLKRFHRSCPVIVSAAGSYYTFENSIVLVTLDNTVQLTLNLLLMSNRQ